LVSQNADGFCCLMVGNFFNIKNAVLWTVVFETIIRTPWCFDIVFDTIIGKSDVASGITNLSPDIRW
jgi:hypothetical protein